MTDRSIRTLDATEIRAAETLFRASLHQRPDTDEEWRRAERTYQDGRTLGAFEDDILVGTARSIDTTLTVPGGTVPMAAVTGVGVRVGRTRRGVLTDLTTAVGDELWLRVVDVAAALNARGYTGDDSVVLEVSDPLLRHNSGRYRLSAAGCEPVTAPAQLALDVATLGMLYLGGWRVDELVNAGRIEVTDAGAVAATHRLLATDRPPWCGSFF
ncbi:MAG: GNAT family N-acetyltransferase [Actinophytocola sp.]|nr:GNAT family N-acetyltransferase [Actinophytocola sp.]